MGKIISVNITDHSSTDIFADVVIEQILIVRKSIFKTCREKINHTVNVSIDINFYDYCKYTNTGATVYPYDINNAMSKLIKLQWEKIKKGDD